MSDERPLPIITEQNRPFWQATSERRFVLPACHACRRMFFPIAPVCPHCHSMDLGWAPASGRGKVSSFIVYHQAFFAFFRDKTPYVVVQVALEEGPRFNANLLSVTPDDVRIGMEVAMVYERVTDEITLPQFVPAHGRSATAAPA